MSNEYLSKQQILGAVDIKTEPVDVPEWGGKVLVRGLTGDQRDAFEDMIVERKKGGQKINVRGVRAKLCALSIVDADGKPIFTEADVEALGHKSSSALTRVFQVASKLSGLDDSDVEAMAADFPPAQRGASTSV
jgi:hypothetical protein